LILSARHLYETYLDDNFFVSTLF